MQGYRVRCTGTYLVKGDKKMMIGEHPYQAKEIKGYSNKRYPVIVTNIATGEVLTFNPGKPIKIKKKDK